MLSIGRGLPASAHKSTIMDVPLEDPPSQMRIQWRCLPKAEIRLLEYKFLQEYWDIEKTYRAPEQNAQSVPGPDLVGYKV